MSARRPAYPKAPPREEGVWRLERECWRGGYSEGLCVVYTTMRGDPPPQQRGKQRGMGSHSAPGVALLHASARAVPLPLSSEALP